MREILVYDDYEIHKLGTGGGTQYEEVTTEKATRIDVTDVAKPKGKLIPFGRTEQTQFQGYNLFDYTQVVDLAYGRSQGESSMKILRSSLYRGYYIPVTPGEQYFVSRKNTTDFNRFRYCFTEVKPAPNVTVISESQETRDTYTSFDTVVPEGAGYLFFYMSNEGTDITPEMELQITKSEELLPYEPYVGGTASPSPEFPQPIENVEGRSTTNLVKVTTDNSLNSNTGGYGNYSINDATHEVISTGKTLMGLKVKVEPSTQYSIRYLLKDTDDTIIKNMRVREYSAEPITSTDWSGESFITQSVNNSTSTAGYKSKTITTQENTQWILFIFYSNGGNTTVAEWQVNKGSMLLPYEPYFEGKRLDFNVCDKNIFDNEWELGIIRGDTGGNQDNSSYIRSKNFIPVKELTNYKISDKNNIFNRMLVYEYKSDFSYNLTTNKNVYNYFTTEKDTAYIRIRPGVEMTDTSVEVQIEEGTTATSYEEHKEQMIPFPLAEGQKLMEGDYLADDGVHHVRTKMTLNGTETWNQYTSIDTDNYYGYRVDAPANMKLPTNSTTLTNYVCDKFTEISWNGMLHIGNRPAFAIRFDNARIYIHAPFATIAELTEWLSNNNTTIEYDLTEEVVDPYTEAQQEAYNKLKNLKLYKGVNHIWTETDGLEANLQLTYKRIKQEGVLQVSNTQQLNNLEINNTEETPEELTPEIYEE